MNITCEKENIYKKMTRGVSYLFTVSKEMFNGEYDDMFLLSNLTAILTNSDPFLENYVLKAALSRGNSRSVELGEIPLELVYSVINKHKDRYERLMNASRTLVSNRVDSFLDKEGYNTTNKEWNLKDMFETVLVDTNYTGLVENGLVTSLYWRNLSDLYTAYISGSCDKLNITSSDRNLTVGPIFNSIMILLEQFVVNESASLYFAVGRDPLI
jgi:hypothetical protein